jgi:diguanylate cyclase (GGDEF)-like protein/putative nucleotidyltransferase with HDIG domain
MMQSPDVSGYNRAIRLYWAVLFVCVSVVAVWTVYESRTFTNVPMMRALTPLFLLAGISYFTRKMLLDRLSAKADEAEVMSRLHLATAEALATAIDAKDQTTHCHVRRVQLYAEGMGQAFALADSEIAALKSGALLHDIGKLAVPAHILNKPGRLTPAEFEKMKIHTIVGAQILSRVDFPFPVVPIVRHHHEQWDGRGYPDGLAGDQIPLTARIFSVVDSFDSVREDRPFRHGMTRDEAIAMLRRGSGTHFDPQVVESFIQNLPRFEAEISAQSLQPQRNASDFRQPLKMAHVDIAQSRERGCYQAYNQIKDADREGYALYEIARTFGSSLELKETLAVLVDKVGHLVPWDTCAVYLYDEPKGHATAAHVVGQYADLIKTRSFSPGEGVTGFALANRSPVNQLHPNLDFMDFGLPGSTFRSMASLPLFKEDVLIGALSVYSVELDQYTDDHMRMLETVTRLASDALTNAMHHAEAESNALTDPLTGLPNPRYMALRFEQEVSRARRTGRPFQVVMLDLDDFKSVNDTFGHKVGDKMLREVAHLIQEQLREYDFMARYAGDEFVAIVQEVGDAQVEDLSSRIENAVAHFAMRVSGDKYARVGISVGTATFDIDGETLDQLLIVADQAMYRVKSEHKHAVKVDRATVVSPLLTGTPLRANSPTRSDTDLGDTILSDNVLSDTIPAAPINSHVDDELASISVN